MFTGIVQAMGRITEVAKGPSAVRLVIDPGELPVDDVAIGGRRARARLDPVGGPRQERRRDRIEGEVHVLPAVVGADRRRQSGRVIEVPGVGPAAGGDTDLADVANHTAMLSIGA